MAALCTDIVATLAAEAEMIPLEAAVAKFIADPSISHFVFLDVEGLRCLQAPVLPPTIVLPGSFNPMHDGHKEMARLSAECCGRPASQALFELCVQNADKGTLEEAEICRRVREGVCSHGCRMLVTRCTLFKAKAALCAGSDFAVGYDTYQRIVNPKYYLPAGVSMDDADDALKYRGVMEGLEELARYRVRLVIAGRVDAGGEYKSLLTHPLFELPEDKSGLFIALPDFRNDTSSTALRAAMAAKAKH